MMHCFYCKELLNSNLNGSLVCVNTNCHETRAANMYFSDERCRIPFFINKKSVGWIFVNPINRSSLLVIGSRTFEPPYFELKRDDSFDKALAQYMNYLCKMYRKLQ